VTLAQWIGDTRAIVLLIALFLIVVFFASWMSRGCG
jgi:hypothetical protein